jgi:hypothetical protein
VKQNSEGFGNCYFRQIRLFYVKLHASTVHTLRSFLRRGRSRIEASFFSTFIFFSLEFDVDVLHNNQNKKTITKLKLN